MSTKPYLQPYKGKATRHECPACKAKQSFTLYLDGDTGLPVNNNVGKCNRQIKCGYHYTPKQYYHDNNGEYSINNRDKSNYSNSSNNSNTATVSNNFLSGKNPSPLTQNSLASNEKFDTIPFSFVEKSTSYQSNFVRFLCEIMDENQIRQIGEDYALGATRNKEVIFWQIDTNGKVRTGKIMQYNPETGKRIKHESGAIDWIHNKLKKTNQIPSNFELKQCFFGEHLLKIYPERIIAIVESEKTACIASVCFPDLIWLGAGNLNGISVEKCKILKGRNVILFPDLKAYDVWNNKMIEIKKSCNCNIKISSMLERTSSADEKEKGLDIADFLIAQLLSQVQLQSYDDNGTVKNQTTPLLQLFLRQSKPLSLLIDRLDLVEV